MTENATDGRCRGLAQQGQKKLVGCEELKIFSSQPSKKFLTVDRFGVREEFFWDKRNRQKELAEGEGNRKAFLMFFSLEQQLLSLMLAVLIVLLSDGVLPIFPIIRLTSLLSQIINPSKSV